MEFYSDAVMDDAKDVRFIVRSCIWYTKGFHSKETNKKKKCSVILLGEAREVI